MIESLPSNREIEQMVLGTAFVSDRTADRIISICEPVDFYYEAHQKILSTICEIRQKNMSIDLTSLLNYVDDGYMIEAAALGNQVITDDYLGQYLQQLKELSFRLDV